MTTEILDQPPGGPTLTSYDRAHTKLYLRLLDAERDGAGWREAAKILLGIDPVMNPARAEAVFASHLARAHWISNHGYRQLLK